jgi:hypothetical protein
MADTAVTKPIEMDSKEPPSDNGNDDDQQSPEKQSPTMTKWGKTRRYIVPAVAVACSGLIAGLIILLSINAGGGNVECTTAPPLQLRRLSYFDESALKGYDRCQDLEDDLKEALEIIANITIDSFAVSKFRNYGYPYILRGDEEPGFGGGLYYSEGEPPVMSDGGTSTGGSSAAPGSGENSFGTNNQVDGVDEADQVKSDGNHIFVAYGDMIIVTDAKTGTELSRTQLPTDDENGIPRCDDVKGFINGDTECYNGSGSYRGGGRSDIKVASLMLHKSTLAVVASTSLVLQNRVPGLMNDRNTRIFIYDVSDIPSDLSPLTLMARKDLQGSYQTARSIGGYSHIVTSSNLDTHYHVGTHLNPWDKRYIDMKEEEYRSQAFLEAQKKIPHYAGILTSELRDLSERNGVVDDECSFISKVAIMLKQQATSTSTVLPSFTDASSLKTLTQVYSLDLQQEFDVDTGTITTTSSGVFFPTSSYTSNVYASDTKLVIAGESYAENEEGQWIEHTILLVYDLQNATSVPFAVGDVPGSLLNQFSMDHYYEPSSGQDYLRIATTSWGRWGAVDDLWRQIQTSESQVSVLHIPTANNENAGGLELVGSVGEIGVGERIYSARFFGERAYVVTCKLYLCCTILSPQFRMHYITYFSRLYFIWHSSSNRSFLHYRFIRPNAADGSWRAQDPGLLELPTSCE